MNEIKPLLDYLLFEKKEDLLTEQDRKRIDETGRLIVVGILQKADTENGNGRVYPLNVLSREIENYKILVKERRALGELDHPDSSEVSLKNASHIITDIWMQGNDVYGKAEILPTTAGKDLQALIEAGVKLGISSRGLGSTRQKNGKTLVEDDFQLICFDFVADPSTPGAFMMKESRQRQLVEAAKNKLFDKNYRVNRILNQILSN
jgi:hypothetical protein